MGGMVTIAMEGAQIIVPTNPPPAFMWEHPAAVKSRKSPHGPLQSEGDVPGASLMLLMVTAGSLCKEPQKLPREERESTDSVGSTAKPCWPHFIRKGSLKSGFLIGIKQSWVAGHHSRRLEHPWGSLCFHR